MPLGIGKRKEPNEVGDAVDFPEGDEESPLVDLKEAKAEKNPKAPEPIKKKDPADQNIVYDWMTGEEVGSVRNVITNEKGSTVAYEVKSLAGNIMQYSASQVDLTEEGYILLPIWLSKGRENRDRLSDASRKLEELRKMLESRTVSLETYSEMAKVTFNLELLDSAERSVVEIESMMTSIRGEKARMEQEIYSADIKRRVGLIDRVEYAKTTTDLIDSYKRILYHISESEALHKEVVKAIGDAKKMEEMPGENLDALRERKYKLHFVLSSNPLANVQVRKLDN